MQHAISVIFPVLTIIIGGACILLFSVTTTLRAANTDLRDRAKDLEGQVQRLEEKVHSQAAEIAIWQKTVTGEVHLVAITDLLSTHHTESVQKWDELGQTLTHTDLTLDGMAEQSRTMATAINNLVTALMEGKK